MANITDQQNVEQTQGNRPQTRTKSRLEARQLDREERKKRRLQRRELLEHIANNPSSYEPYLKEGEGYRDFMGRVEDLYDNDIITNVEDAQKYFSAPDLNAKYKVQGSISYNGTNYNVDQTFTNDWEKKFRQVHENWASKNLSKSEQKEYLMDLERQIRDIKSGNFSLNTNTLAGQNTAQILAKMQGIADQATREESEQKVSDEAAAKKKKEEELANKWNKFDYAVESGLNDKAQEILDTIIGQHLVIGTDTKKTIDELLLDNEDYRAHKDNIYKAYGLEVPVVADDGGAAGDDGGNQDEEEPWVYTNMGNTFTLDKQLPNNEGINALYNELFKDLDEVDADGNLIDYRLYEYNLGNNKRAVIMKGGNNKLSQSDLDGMKMAIITRDADGNDSYEIGKYQNGQFQSNKGASYSLDFSDVTKVQYRAIPDFIDSVVEEVINGDGSQSLGEVEQATDNTDIASKYYQAYNNEEYKDILENINTNLEDVALGPARSVGSGRFNVEYTQEEFNTAIQIAAQTAINIFNSNDNRYILNDNKDIKIPQSLHKILSVSNKDPYKDHLKAYAFIYSYLCNTTTDQTIKNKALQVYNAIKNTLNVTGNSLGDIMKAQEGAKISFQVKKPEVIVESEQPTQNSDVVQQQSQKPVSGKAYKSMSDTGVLDWVQIGATAASMLGGVIGGATGLVGAGIDMYNVWSDDNISTEEAIKHSAISLSLAALSFIPGIGAAAKAGKFAKMAKGTKTLLNGSKSVLQKAVASAGDDAAKTAIQNGIKLLDNAVEVTKKPGFVQKAIPSIMGGFDGKVAQGVSKFLNSESSYTGLIGDAFKYSVKGVGTVLGKAADASTKVGKLGTTINTAATIYSALDTPGAISSIYRDVASGNWSNMNFYDIINILNTSAGISGVARRPRYAKQSAAEGLIGRTPKAGEQTIKVSVKPRLSVKQKPIDVDVTLNSNTTKKQLKEKVIETINSLPDDNPNKSTLQDIIGKKAGFSIDYDAKQFKAFNNQDSYYYVKALDDAAGEIQKGIYDDLRKNGMLTKDELEQLMKINKTSSMDVTEQQAQELASKFSNKSDLKFNDVLDYLLNLRTKSSTVPSSRPQTTPNPQAVSTPQAAPNPPATPKPVSTPQQLSYLDKRGGTLVKYNKKGGSLSYEDRIALQAFKSKLSREEREYIQRLKNRNQELKISYQSFKNALDRIDANKDKATKGLLTTRLLILKSLM